MGRWCACWLQPQVQCRLARAVDRPHSAAAPLHGYCQSTATSEIVKRAVLVRRVSCAIYESDLYFFYLFTTFPYPAEVDIYGSIPPLSKIILNIRHCLCKLFIVLRGHGGHSLFPQIDIIGAMVIVWRVRGKIIRSVLCSIVCNNCAQCNAHTYEQT